MLAAALVGVFSGPSPAATPGFGSAASAATPAAAQTLTIARPAAAGAGQVLVAAVAFRVEAAISAPSGWTQAVSTSCSSSGISLTQAVFVKAATASEPDTYSFSVAAASGGSGSVAVYSGVDAAQPVLASGGQISRNSVAIIGPSIVPAVSGSLLVGAFAGSGRAAIPTPSGMTLRGGAATGSSAPAARTLLADELLAGAAPTGDRRVQVDAKNVCNVGQLVALRPAPDPPSSTGLPLVSGTPQEGSVLRATSGSWSNAPTGFAYRWQRSGDGGGTWADAPGATAAEHALTGADVGFRIRVVVTASNAGGPVSAASGATAAVLPAAPASTSPPTISGTPVEDETLVADPGTWSGSPTAYGYAWQRSADGGQTWSGVPGATAATHGLTGADVGSAVRVLVTATNAGGSASAASAPTASVEPAGPPVAPTSVDPPSIEGTPRHGLPLTASTGTWAGRPRSFAFQWRRSTDGGQTWADIPDAQAASYTPRTEDVGLRLGVTVTASNPAGSASASSGASEAVLPSPPAGTAPPLVTGNAVEGSTLLASPGEWLADPVSYAFEWQRCSAPGSCTSIRWGTGPDYVVKDDDVGMTIRAVVTAWNLGGSASAASVETPVVLPRAPVNEEPPTITGIPGQGETLTAAPGDWDSSATVTYAYRWQRSGDGGTWTLVQGANGPAYVPAAADVGFVFRVVVTASNAGGSASAPSAATTAVTGPGTPANVAAPALSGIVQQGERLTVADGTWSGLPTYTYAWQRSTNGGATWTAIARARTFRYVPTAADVGRLVRASVTARNAHGSATTTSSPTEIFPAGNRVIAINTTWFCDDAVDLELVRVTNTDGVDRDATRFDDCSGRIARVEIVTDGADGLKIRNSLPVAHDLTIEGGWVRCTDRAEGAHQDGIQVMGGSRITFRNLVVFCGDPDGGLGDGVNSSAFVNAAGAGDTTPTDIVIEHSVMGLGNANGVLIEQSVRSGIRNSVACPDWTLGGAVHIGEGAVDGIDAGNEKPPREDERCASFAAALAWAQP